MKPVRTPRCTTVDVGPIGTNVEPLPTWRERDPHRDATVVFSVWQPTTEERAAIAAGAYVLLGMWQDPIPPVYIGVVQGEEYEPLVRLDAPEART